MGRKFHRMAGRRRLFLQALLQNLIKHGRMTTTVARAKEVRPIAERLVTIGKRGRVSDLRLIKRRLPPAAALKLFHEIAPRYADRHGGYLRIIKQGRSRKRDAAPLATIEFV